MPNRKFCGASGPFFMILGIGVLLASGSSISANPPADPPTWIALGGSASSTGLSNTSQHSFAADIAVDSLGRPVVAWYDETPAGRPLWWWDRWGRGIFLKRWNGVSWEELGGSASGYGLSPSPTADCEAIGIALNSAGNPAVAWGDSSGGQILFRMWDGSAWIGLADSDTPAGMSMGVSGRRPRVAFDSHDCPYVAWYGAGPEGTEMFLRKWDGTAWIELGGSGSGAGLSQGHGGGAEVSLAIGPDDKPVVAWGQYHEDGASVYLKKWDGLAWVEVGGSATGRGVSNRSGWSGHPWVEVDRSGNPFVLWYSDYAGSADQYGDNKELFLKYWNGSAWTELGGSASDGGVSSTPGFSYYPCMRLDPAGKPVVVWTEIRLDGNSEIMVKRWDGLNWVEIAGSASDGGISANPSNSVFGRLALDATGSPFVSWNDNSSTNYEILLKRYAPLAGETPTGADVTVVPMVEATGTSPVAVTFENIVSSGTTTVTEAGSVAGAPQRFKFGTPPVVYQISTTAVMASGTRVTVRVSYPQGSMPEGEKEESKQVLMHYNGTDWEPPIAGSEFLDMTSNVIGGDYYGLSPFAIMFPSNSEPAANAGPDLAIEASGANSTIDLDGSASTDEDGDELTYAWTWDVGSAVGPTPEISLPLGVYTITLTVTDPDGASSSDTVVITVQDTTAPAFTALTATPDSLWPPNHQMVAVTLTGTATDACDPAPAFSIVAVTSNEPTEGLGDGDTPTDWEVTGAMTLNLRAERSGTGSGRVYSITVRATDASGNASEKTVTVSVPKSKKK